MSAFRTSKAAPTRRPSKPKKRRTGGPKKRINKKSGDVRSMPDQGRALAPARPAGPLDGKAIRHLRALGHHLDPVVQIGKEGITDALVAAARAALLAHELVKVRVGQEAPVDRKEAGAELAEKTSAVLAQVIGRTLLLYKRHPRKPKIELPR